VCVQRKIQTKQSNKGALIVIFWNEIYKIAQVQACNSIVKNHKHWTTQTRHLFIFLKSLKTIGETIKEDLEVNSLAINMIDDRWFRLIHDGGRVRHSYCCCKMCVEKYFKIKVTLVPSCKNYNSCSLDLCSLFQLDVTNTIPASLT
jgi:hypothetical protein